MNEGFNVPSFAPFVGAARPVDSVIEPDGVLKAGYTIGKWNHVDGSEYRGYRYPTGQLVGSCMVPSAARLAALAAQTATQTSDRTARENLLSSIPPLAQQVKDGAGLTVAQQLTLLRALSVKLARVCVGVLSDLP